MSLFMSCGLHLKEMIFVVVDCLVLSMSAADQPLLLEHQPQ